MIANMILTFNIIYAMGIALILVINMIGGDDATDIAIASAVKFVIKLLLVLFVMFMLLKLIDTQMQ